GIRPGNGHFQPVGGTEGHDELDAGELFFDGWCCRYTGATPMGDVPLEIPLGDNAVDTVAVLLESVEGEVVPNQRRDDQRGADTDGETDNIDDREELVAPEIPKGDEEIIFEHMAMGLPLD